MGSTSVSSDWWTGELTCPPTFARAKYTPDLMACNEQDLPLGLSPKAMIHGRQYQIAVSDCQFGANIAIFALFI
jgi:hypothetical protein